MKRLEIFYDAIKPNVAMKYTGIYPKRNRRIIQEK
ncbi:hypothetical protein J2S24_001483 [Thermoanaerobacter pentosaceus]|uniref:Uncharacterized protein n=1 Tax=Thermoanaerobacter pentosaceus TaxID=694059 RepID=A0ABT9M4D1_9THEO|nr:hypothetical protein [Thermoanaerobacter pentosaceus]